MEAGTGDPHAMATGTTENTRETTADLDPARMIQQMKEEEIARRAPIHTFFEEKEEKEDEEIWYDASGEMFDEEQEHTMLIPHLQYQNDEEVVQGVDNGDEEEQEEGEQQQGRYQETFSPPVEKEAQHQEHQDQAEKEVVAPSSPSGVEKEGQIKETEYWGPEPYPEEWALINQLQKALDDDGIDIPEPFWLSNYGESREGLLWRFIVANDFHIERAKALLIGDIKWRDEIDIIKLHSMTLEEVVGCSKEIFHQHYTSAVLGYDEEDHHSPVVYQCIKHMKTYELLKHTTVEKMIKHQLWEFETHAKHLFMRPETFPPRKLKVIIDIHDMIWKQCTTQLLQILSGFSEASKLHHPERLTTRQKINILNNSETRGHPWVSAWLKKVP